MCIKASLPIVSGITNSFKFPIYNAAITHALNYSEEMDLVLENPEVSMLLEAFSSTGREMEKSPSVGEIFSDKARDRSLPL